MAATPVPLSATVLVPNFKDGFGHVLHVGDRIAYVGRQDLKAFLVRGTVIVVEPHRVAVRPTQSSCPLGQPTKEFVWLSVPRKILLIRRKS